MKFQFIILVTMFSSLSYSQISNESILDDLKIDIITTDSDTEKLVTNTGFNVFIQRKVMNYLTGVSDLSLAKFYSTYTGDNDKLNLGFNIPLVNKDTKRLSWVINPILEADFKNNFATLYKDDKWKNNIRGGFKLTYLIPLSTMNFLTTNGYTILT